MAPKNKELDCSNESIVQQYEEKEKTKEKKYIIKGGGKGSIPIELGSYKPLKPMVVYFMCMQLYRVLVERPDEPVSLPMKGRFLVDNEIYVFTISLLYACFSIVWGPRMMVNRDPIKPKKLMIFYNLFQVFANFYIFWTGGQILIFSCMGLKAHDPSIRLEPCNPKCEPEDRSETVMYTKSAHVFHLYFLLKMLDLCDTVFLVLQKKWAHISLLHVFHHYGMFYASWGFVKYIASGQLSAIGWINSIVHVILYLYYFLALLGPEVQKYLWWKKYLTLIQLIQFFIILFYIARTFINKCEIHFHSKVNAVIYTIFFIYLFADFYRKEYSKKKQE